MPTDDFLQNSKREKKNTGKDVGIMTKKMAHILFHTSMFL